jgi:hypothetical protein
MNNLKNGNDSKTVTINPCHEIDIIPNKEFKSLGIIEK